jgi:4-hydroxybenzoate polyprenyltransferase
MLPIMDAVSLGFTATIRPLVSLAIDRLKYSHMYTTMGLLGILVSAQGSGLTILQVLHVLPITIVTTGLYILNDVFDIEIDRISHSDRALPRGDVSERAAIIAGSSLIVIGTAAAFYLDMLAGFLVGAIGLFGVLYSVPPFRLRKFPVVPSVIIGFFVFLAFLAGYSYFKENIPSVIFLGVMLLWAMFVGCSSAKDLGDVEGDQKAGVSTLPTMLGFEKGFRITSVLVYSAFLFPIIFIILLDFPRILIVPILIFLITEIYVMEKFGRMHEEPKARKWYGAAFGQFILVQVTLLVGALV